MNTISVTVDKANNALLLAEWLKNIRFVKEVNVHMDERSSSNIEAVQKMLDSMKSKHFFTDIVDPVAYQRKIRDEWS